eukprot:CAMPEP_0182562040 /NCGR_PEP_ID=MMETSP1324-20130603/4438_1 /TAXON_ID=236786 /ORGANISM="Florenciella sp., Strain RCC1587" /LENGTH=42 /DNA_ID= /DNA_START= /DNA_END= /DNA_ORIENTATION=
MSLVGTRDLMVLTFRSFLVLSAEKPRELEDCLPAPPPPPICP